MAHFFLLRERLDEVAQQHFKMLQDASDNLPRETEAVVRIQCFYRASKVQNCWRAVVGGAVLIQRASRGWLARSRMKALRFNRSRRLNTYFFHHCAAVIQKFFRGWRSRRHLHDFYGRKAYLQKVEMRGGWTVDYLRNAQQDQLMAAKAEEEKQMRHEFDNLAGELHHLVSTKTICGVYNPPFSDALPRAFDKPIEQHLRDACRVQMPRCLRRPRHRVALASISAQDWHASHADRMAKDGALGSPGPPQDLPERQPHRSRSASAGRMQKIQGPFRSKEQIEVANAKASNMYRSLQSTASYEVMEEDRKMQQKLSKLVRVSPVDFMAPGQPVEKPPPSSVHTNVPWREKPVEFRNDYTELPKVRDKPPFFTALQQDRHFQDYQEQPLLPSGHV
mmetsp:Transcript_52739/g.112845  ORF Transcript_52739/g.112845 Transcript_52739/m.112845 type:complete len:392 (+) Transcript_52739:61-1236(+)